MNADLLTATLRDTGLARRLLDLSALGDGLAVRFPCERSLGLHVVRQGPVHLHAPGLAQPLLLDSGDVAVMARGCNHVLSTRARLAGQKIEPIRVGAAPADAALARVLSGAYQLWHAPLHPLFAEMPAWSVLRAAELPRLGPLALVNGLLDVVFTYALREVLARCAAARPGWSQAAGDAQVGRAVALMHEDLAQPWTLESLARGAGLSRTALAERFRATMGDTPLNHLRTLRMQRAMALLGQTRHTLEQVAAAVGYQDAFSFSKVFKRSTGQSPKAFRSADAAQRGSPLRFEGQG